MKYLVAETRGEPHCGNCHVERLQRSHAVHFFAQRVTREVAGQSHLAQFLVRETTLQRAPDTVMDQCRQEREFQMFTESSVSAEQEEEPSSKRVHICGMVMLVLGPKTPQPEKNADKQRQVTLCCRLA